ncbi:ABC transporter permease [Gemmatimonadota bacterium Y43]|uniref:ABC transporter permease n=1 Tax=Gaopeijia maritima TaxID=3119007 RepID=UPI00327C408A
MRSLLALLLLVFPRAFREEYGDEVLDQALDDLDRARARGAWAAARMAAATVIDLATTGLAERFDPAWRDPRRTNDEGVGMAMERILRDLRQAVRSLRRTPGFAVATVGTLALALGVNAAIFSVVDAVLIEPLPYDDPGRIVTIMASAPGSDYPDEFPVSAEFYVQYRDESRLLDDVAAYGWSTATVRSDDRVERLRLSQATSSLFTTLGVEPILGRLPLSEDETGVALISHSLWTTWFGGDPAVIGRTAFFMNGQKEIIGVMPEGFSFPIGEVAAWIPDEPDRGEITPGRFGIALVGRLAPGADHEALEEELTGLARRLPELYGGDAAYARLIEAHRPVVRSVTESMLGPVRTALLVLMAAVGVVLLIACANVANLFAVRTEGRARDLAVQRALGADRSRLVGGLLSEAAVISLTAGVLAIALALIALPAWLAVAPAELPRVDEIGLSPLTLVFTLVASLAAGLLCGLVPAFKGADADLGRLRDGLRGSTRGRSTGRSALVVGQTALALVLLVGSGLLLRSVHALQSVDPGFDREGILTFQFAPEQDHLVDGPTWAAFHVEMMDRFRALPGVRTVGIVENVPLDEGTAGVAYFSEDQAVDAEGGVRGGMTFSAGDYFEAMGIEVLRGRTFTDADALEPGTVVITRSLADALWPDADPIGRRIRNTFVEEWHEVIGVVDDVVQNDLREPPQALAYFSLVGPEPNSWGTSSPGYVIRGSDGIGDDLMGRVRGVIGEVAPEAPIYRVYTVASLVERETTQLRFTMLTLVMAAGLALVLGAVGLYGVLSYVVAQRTREIGVRMALGAEAGRVRRMVVGQGVGVVALGIAVGLLVAFVATRALSGLLFGVGATDPWTFVGMAALMAGVGAFASWVPAMRASRVDPIESMRGG